MKLFERFIVTQKEKKQGTLIENDFFRKEIKEYGEEEYKNIQQNNIKLFKSHLEYSVPYSKTDKIIAFLTKIEKIVTNQEPFLYKTQIAYIKLQEHQDIFDMKRMEIIDKLDEYQGVIDFLEVFICPYDDYIKFAVEYKFHSINKEFLAQIIHYLVKTFFLNENINYDTNFEFGKDYTTEDFNQIFNKSRKNKKLIFYIDTIDTNGGAILNSIKQEYSIKGNTMLEKLKELGHIIGKLAKITETPIRYVIKCEDADAKTASHKGYTTADETKAFQEGIINTHEWIHPARISISDNDIQSIYLFLQNKETRNVKTS